MAQKIFFSPKSKTNSVFKKKRDEERKMKEDEEKTENKNESIFSKLTEEKYISKDVLFSNLSQKPGIPMTKSTMLKDLDYVERDFRKKIKNEIKISVGGSNINLYTPMVDIVNSRKLPEKTDIKCFWCRHNFSTSPMGVPVKWVQSVYELRGDTGNVIKKKITVQERKRIENNKNATTDSNIIVNEYYEVDGIYCSMNCIRADLDNLRGNRYKDSYILLCGMYRKLTGIIPGAHDINKAPSWRLLKEYGGDMDIDVYRDSFTRFKYVNTMNLIRPVTQQYQKFNLNK